MAIKVLPEAVAEDAERLARFQREAKVLASLNHANIAAIYSLESAGLSEAAGLRAGRPDSAQVSFLVMELVEGADLTEHIAQGPMLLDRALPIALQIAQAQEAAHESGIIHRDLKPANVKIKPDGQVKVLDFGLAKALTAGPETGRFDSESNGAPGSPESLSLSPTLTQQMTEPGVVLGTAAYMSPEQARGKPVDKRTDIWSFGCLLFEMLAGRNSFQGETGSDTLAAILEREPEWESLPDGLSLRIRDLLRRCLRKDPRERLRDIGDARIELADELSRESVGSIGVETPAAAPKAPKREKLMALVAVIVLLAAFATWRSLPGEQVVYLVDTTAPLGVYDSETRKAGGTNADDLTDALGELPVTLAKENSSPLWRREHQLLVQRPALIVVHLSAFAHQPGVEDFEVLDEALGELETLGLEDPMKLGRDKLMAFLGYIALGSPDTQFIVYSRGTFNDEADRNRWVSDIETRFPEIKGRIFPYPVPGGTGIATFRDPATAIEIKALVASILDLE